MSDNKPPFSSFNSFVALPICHALFAPFDVHAAPCGTNGIGNTVFTFHQIAATTIANNKGNQIAHLDILLTRWYLRLKIISTQPNSLLPAENVLSISFLLVSYGMFRLPLRLLNVPVTGEFVL